MRVDQDVIAVLDRATVAGNALTLVGQLDRKLYERTAKALEAAGGKWSRKAKAHLFECDAATAIEPIILTGEIVSAKQELQAFYSPPAVARRLVELAEIAPGMRVLEPSAGRGAIAERATEAGGRVDCVEIDPRSASWLVGCCVSVIGGDFLSLEPAPVYDRVVMNPPFTRQQDIKHVRHALGFLKPGGLLVSVMSAGVRFRTNALTVEFRDLVETSPRGLFVDLPEDSFKASGTSVHTCIVRIGRAS